MGSGICTRVKVSKTTRFAMLVMANLAIWPPTTHAQLVPSTSAASAPAPDAMERAQRQADNVMRWIKVHAEKPRAAPIKTVDPSVKTMLAPQVPKAAVVAAPVAESFKAVATSTPEPFAPPQEASPTARQQQAEAAVVAAEEPSPEPPEEEAEPLKAIMLEQPAIPINVLSVLNAPSKIVVQFTVDTSGAVSDIKVLSSGRSQLNKPTIAAINKWRFEPIKTPRVERVEFTFTP